MTIQEYLDRNNMSRNSLSTLAGVSPNAISKLIRGVGRCNCETAEKFRKLGIVIPEDMILSKEEKGKMGAEASRLSGRNKVKPKKTTNQKVVLERFQIYAMKEFGNTIVARKYKTENIVSAFAELGLDVKVRRFNGIEFASDDTHYIVELAD